MIWETPNKPEKKKATNLQENLEWGKLQEK